MQPSKEQTQTPMTKAGFMFGPWSCKWSEVFFLGKHSLAMVNLKPIVPGHCLVIPKRVTPHFDDLSAEEVSDLWNTAKLVGTPLRTFFKGEALTFAIQDGVAAGQTVPHVHIHVLPRVPGDFGRNDQVYDELEKADVGKAFAVDDEERKPRTLKEMCDEAAVLRTLYTTSLPIPSDETSTAET